MSDEVTVQPRILKFEASASSVNLGDNVQLSWTTQNAKQIGIQSDPAGVDVTPTDIGEGMYEFAPTVTASYTLTAIRDASQVTSDLTIDVISISAPKITRFAVNPSLILLGANESVQFSWTTENATYVQINWNGNLLYGTKASEGTYDMSPGQIGAYTLVAMGDGGQQTTSAVDVLPLITNPL
jgi:hypothetical protein